MALVAFAIIKYYISLIIRKLDAQSEGVRTYSFIDIHIGKFMKLRQQLHRTPRGKVVLKRGLIGNKYMEHYLYLYLPNFLYNSENFRNFLKLFNDVLYPVCVIVIPLISSTLPLIYPLLEHLHQLYEKDIVLRAIVYVWRLATTPVLQLLDMLKLDFLAPVTSAVGSGYASGVGVASAMLAWF